MGSVERRTRRPARRRLVLPSFAKVNLGLEVLGVRQDGYHELRTLFQSIDLADEVEIRLSDDGAVTVECDHPLVPRDGTNLAAKAAEELRRWSRGRWGAVIRIRKRIPVGGGLGGGSSNAAVVLLGLDRLLRLGLGPAGLHPFARRLGADVPYFLYGGTALGLARGDEIYPLAPQVKGFVVVVDAGVAVQTEAVFRRIDARLTPRENSTSIYAFVSKGLAGHDAFGLLSNDLEPAAWEESPTLAARAGRIRAVLRREGAILAALSGSGGCYFGVFDEAGRARRAQAVLKTEGLTAVRASVLNRDRFRRYFF